MQYDTFVQSARIRYYINVNRIFDTQVIRSQFLLDSGTIKRSFIQSLKITFNTLFIYLIFNINMIDI